MRRLWLENAFQPDNPEIWPLISEPRLLTVESALARALSVNFDPIAMGGGSDVLGMARMNVNTGSSPVEEGSWREHFQLVLDVSAVFFFSLTPQRGFSGKLARFRGTG
jgi:hypothetical protein